MLIKNEFEQQLTFIIGMGPLIIDCTLLPIAIGETALANLGCCDKHVLRLAKWLPGSVQD